MVNWKLRAQASRFAAVQFSIFQFEIKTYMLKSKVYRYQEKSLPVHQLNFLWFKCVSFQILQQHFFKLYLERHQLLHFKGTLPLIGKLLLYWRHHHSPRSLKEVWAEMPLPCSEISICQYLICDFVNGKHPFLSITNEIL